MSDRQLQIGNARPQTETADVFVRLSQRIEEMRRKDRGNLDPVALANKLAKRAKVLRGRIGKGEPAGPQISFLAFRHGSQRYGIAISDIVVVQTFSDYTPVPGVPQFITGVIHWRGAIISLVDLTKLFGIPQSGLLNERACLIVEAAGRRVGILAGEVEELHTAPLNQVKSVPELSTDVPPEWLMGVHDENRLILNIVQILQDERLTNWKEK